MKVEITQADGVAGRRIPLLPWLALLFLGLAALGAWFLIGPTLHGTRYYKVGYNRTAYEYSRALVLLFIPYGLALFAWRRGSRAPLWVLIAGAAVLHVLVLFAPLPQSQDFYQYLFYGKMQAVHGVNPFVVNPSLFWADRWFPWIRWNTQPSVYGPVWILISAGVVKTVGHSLASAFIGLKLVILALDAAVVALIISLARGRSDRAGWGVLAYAWNPLVLVAVPVAGSADVGVAAAFLGAVLARRRGRTAVATVLLSLAALVKVYAILGLILHLALLLKDRGSKRALAHAGGAAGIAAIAYAPYWNGFSTFSGLASASGLTNQSLMGTFQRTVVAYLLHVSGFHPWYTGSIVLTRVLSAAILLGVLAWGIRKVHDDESLWFATLVVMMAYLWLTPWFLYWYVLAPLALVVVIQRNRFTDPILTFSGTSLISIYLPVAPALWIVQTLLRYGQPVAVLALQRGFRRAEQREADGLEDGEERSQRRKVRSTQPVAASSALAGRAPAAK